MSLSLVSSNPCKFTSFDLNFFFQVQRKRDIIQVNTVSFITMVNMRSKSTSWHIYQSTYFPSFLLIKLHNSPSLNWMFSAIQLEPNQPPLTLQLVMKYKTTNYWQYDALLFYTVQDYSMGNKQFSNACKRLV